MASWGVAKAKAQFSAVLDKAEQEGAQLVQRRRRRFILLTEEELAKRTSDHETTKSGKTSGQSLWEALRPATEDRVDFEIPRLKWKPRKVTF